MPEYPGGDRGSMRDPDGPPDPMHVPLPPWPGDVAHLRWLGTGTIWLLAEPVYGPDDPVDLRCGHCTAATVIYLDSLLRGIMFTICHQRGCPAVDDMLAMAGVAS